MENLTRIIEEIESGLEGINTKDTEVAKDLVELLTEDAYTKTFLGVHIFQSGLIIDFTCPNRFNKTIFSIFFDKKIFEIDILDDNKEYQTVLAIDKLDWYYEPLNSKVGEVLNKLW